MWTHWSPLDDFQNCFNCSQVRIINSENVWRTQTLEIIILASDLKTLNREDHNRCIQDVPFWRWASLWVELVPALSLLHSRKCIQWQCTPRDQEIQWDRLIPQEPEESCCFIYDIHVVKYYLIPWQLMWWLCTGENSECRDWEHHVEGQTLDPVELLHALQSTSSAVLGDQIFPGKWWRRISRGYDRCIH